MKFYDYLIVGAGLSGCVFAERAASQLNKNVLIVEKRNHIAGNAYDETDEYGVLVHRYGPHIFHTNNKKVVDYLSQFTEWNRYVHKVLAKLDKEHFPIPINIATINKLYDMNISNEDEAREFFGRVSGRRSPVVTSEDVMINRIGDDLFKKFFKNYTLKQWGVEPKYLFASVCGRIPVRYDFNDFYFDDKYQLMPKYGYTEMFKKMLDNKRIEVLLNVDYKNIVEDIKFNTLIFTGPIDYYFDFIYGKLPYRSIEFKYEHYDKDFVQPAAQINHVDLSVPFTRSLEHKYLTGQKISGSTLSFEYPSKNGEPLYPVPNKNNHELFGKYKRLADGMKSVLFIGRLAKYKYYNMDQVVDNALKAFEKICEKR